MSFPTVSVDPLSKALPNEGEVKMASEMTTTGPMISIGDLKTAWSGSKCRMCPNRLSTRCKIVMGKKSFIAEKKAPKEYPPDRRPKTG
jgi:hypothetical protein